VRILTIEELIAGKQLGYPKTLAPQATFKKAKKQPKSGETGAHPETMFEDGLLAGGEE